MFFIGGVGQGSKVLNFSGTILCRFCGSQSGCQVVMTYYYFSFFFIPLFKWNKRYLIRMSCCDAVYELAPDVGRAIARGEMVEIRDQDLKLVQDGRYRYSSVQASAAQDGEPEEIPQTRRCPICKSEVPGEYKYCPHCGQRLR